MAKQLAPSKLVPENTYRVQYGEDTVEAVYKGTGMAGNDNTPLKPYIANGYARMCYGDRFIFEVNGRQFLLRKAFTETGKGGLAPDNIVGPMDTAKILAKFYA